MEEKKTKVVMVMAHPDDEIIFGWPIFQDDDYEKEIIMCLKMLKETHADTGFMHESFHKDDPFDFSRSWFAWANTLFGEFIIKVYNERPWILKNNFS